MLIFKCKLQQSLINAVSCQFLQVHANLEQGPRQSEDSRSQERVELGGRKGGCSPVTGEIRGVTGEGAWSKAAGADGPVLFQ